MLRENASNANRLKHVTVIMRNGAVHIYPDVVRMATTVLGWLKIIRYHPSGLFSTNFWPDYIKEVVVR